MISFLNVSSVHLFLLIPSSLLSSLRLPLRRDADGYYWITGRADDVVIVSGHNLGTAEVEASLVRFPPPSLPPFLPPLLLTPSGPPSFPQAQHPGVAEAAVVGIPHDIKGNCLNCYVTLKAGQEPSPDLAKQLKASVCLSFTPSLPPSFLSSSSSFAARLVLYNRISI